METLTGVLEVVLVDDQKKFHTEVGGKVVIIDVVRAETCSHTKNTIHVYKKNGSTGYKLEAYTENGPCPCSIFFNPEKKEVFDRKKIIEEIHAEDFDIGDKLFFYGKIIPWFFR